MRQFSSGVLNGDAGGNTVSTPTAERNIVDLSLHKEKDLRPKRKNEKKTREKKEGKTVTYTHIGFRYGRHTKKKGAPQVGN